MTKTLEHIVSPSSSPKWLKGIWVTTFSALGAGVLVFKVQKFRERRDGNEVLRNSIIARHNSLEKEWNDFLSDPERVLENPALVMDSHRVNITMTDALRRAKMSRVYFATERAKNIRNTTFYKNVANAETEWVVAQKVSSEIGTADLTAEDIRHIKKAKTQLRILKNPNKAKGEKKKAYEALHAELKGVMYIYDATENTLRDYLVKETKPNKA